MLSDENRNGTQKTQDFFFCFEAGNQGGVQCQVTHFTTKNTDTRPHHCTTPDCTLRDNMPQDGCTNTPKVAGVMSPATHYRNTRQDKHIQGKTAQQDKLKDAEDTI